MNEVERGAVFAAASDAVLAALPSAWAIYVYGSFARGEEWPTSDLDVAVLLPPNEKIPDLLGLMAEISKRVHRDVDLVDLREVGDALRREVLADGRTLFTSESGVPGSCIRAFNCSNAGGPGLEWMLHADATRAPLH